MTVPAVRLRIETLSMHGIDLDAGQLRTLRRRLTRELERSLAEMPLTVRASVHMPVLASATRLPGPGPRDPAALGGSLASAVVSAVNRATGERS